MLALDDPRWTTLTHAYGPAGDTPRLLEQLAQTMGEPKRGPQAEPWSTLWSSLCHQSDVFTASYAAVPHLIQMAVTARQPIDFDFFLLPACIDVARNQDKGPSIPLFLRQSYVDGIAMLTEAVCVHRTEDWSQDMVISAAAAIAVGKGHHRLAEALMNLDDDLIRKLVDLTILD
jgi:hypothetical protein